MLVYCLRRLITKGLFPHIEKREFPNIADNSFLAPGCCEQAMKICYNTHYEYIYSHSCQPR